MQSKTRTMQCETITGCYVYLSLKAPSFSPSPPWPPPDQSSCLHVPQQSRTESEDRDKSWADSDYYDEFSPDHQANSPRSRYSDIPSRSRVYRSPPSSALDISTRHHSSRTSSRRYNSSSHTSTTPNFLVCGGTGVGKSFFINLLSSRKAKVGSELISCTSTVESFPCTAPDGSRYNLIDSPGFDDSRMPDAEVLTMLAKFIVNLYASGQEVHGVVFIHRITDIRLSGSLVKTAQIIRRITGEKFKGRFALVTSMWDLVEDRDMEGANRRESELMRHPQFWKDLDGQNFRFSGTERSARKVVYWFVTRMTCPKPPPRLQLYTQLMSGRLVSETDAGIFVIGELSKQRQKHVEAVEQLRYEISQARQERDGDAVKVYSQIQAREEANIRQSDNMLRKMQCSALRS